MAHSSAENVPRSWPTAMQMASSVRAAAFRSRCLSLAKTCSIGFRSGEYFGRKKSLAPAERMSARTALPFVATEIVHDDDVTFAQRGQEDLLDIGSKALAVDRPLKQPRCIDAVMAQGGQEGRGLPAAVRDLGDETLAAWRPSPQRSHVGLGPGLVNEDEALGLDAILILGPLRPSPCDVGPIALASHHGFF